MCLKWLDNKNNFASLEMSISAHSLSYELDAGRHLNEKKVDRQANDIWSARHCAGGCRLSIDGRTAETPCLMATDIISYDSIEAIRDRRTFSYD